MKHYKVILCLVSLIFSTCKQKQKTLQAAKTSLLTAKLMQVCIDSTLALDPGLNGDFLSINSNKAGLKLPLGVSCLLNVRTSNLADKQTLGQLLACNPNVGLTKLDSLLKYDSTWVKHQYFNKIVICIQKVELQKDATILIHTSKIKSSDGAIWTEMVLVFEKDGNSYKCLSSKILTIS